MLCNLLHLLEFCSMLRPGSFLAIIAEAICSLSPPTPLSTGLRPGLLGPTFWCGSFSWALLRRCNFSRIGFGTLSWSYEWGCKVIGSGSAGHRIRLSLDAGRRESEGFRGNPQDFSRISTPLDKSLKIPTRRSCRKNLHRGNKTMKHILGEESEKSGII